MTCSGSSVACEQAAALTGAEAFWLMDGCAGVGGQSTAAGKASDPGGELDSVAELADPSAEACSDSWCCFAEEGPSASSMTCSGSSVASDKAAALAVAEASWLMDGCADVGDTPSPLQARHQTQWRSWALCQSWPLPRLLLRPAPAHGAAL